MKIRKLNDNQTQVNELVEAIAIVVNQILATQPTLTMAVSGGKSPIPLLIDLSKLDIPWDRITITLVDERYVDETSPDSNANLVKTYLLKNKAIHAKFIGLYHENQSLTECVDNANNTIKNIDIAILGMGEDGHTASIFPCSPEYEAATGPKFSSQKYIITHPQTAKYPRIGLSFAGILAIPQLFLSINGEKKLNIINPQAAEINPNYPINQILNMRNNIQVFWHA